MPLEREEVEVTEERNVCPECGSHFVTPLESLETPNPKRVIAHGVGDDVVEYVNVCWVCPWTEYVTMTLERRVEMSDES